MADEVSESLDTKSHYSYTLSQMPHRIVFVDEYLGGIRISIRDWYRCFETAQTIPSQNGVSLTDGEWTTLVGLFPKISKVVEWIQLPTTVSGPKGRALSVILVHEQLGDDGRYQFAVLENMTFVVKIKRQVFHMKSIRLNSRRSGMNLEKKMSMPRKRVRKWSLS